MSSSLAVGLKKGFPVTKVEAAKRPSQAKGKFFFLAPVRQTFDRVQWLAIRGRLQPSAFTCLL